MKEVENLPGLSKQFSRLEDLYVSWISSRLVEK
jgi:hypothetical protein